MRCDLVASAMRRLEGMNLMWIVDAVPVVAVAE